MEKLSGNRIKISNSLKSANMEPKARGSLFHRNVDVTAMSPNWKTVSPEGIFLFFSHVPCVIQLSIK